MKLCMIGCRGHFYYVFESLKETDVKLTAVSSGCEDLPEPLLKSAEAAGFTPKVYDSDYCRMMDEEKPDLVCICGPWHRRAEMCIQALKRNIHVFCEKTVALNLQDLEAIEQAYGNSRAKLIGMMGLRYEAPFQYARQLVKQGAIGKVKLIQTQKSYKLGTRPEFYKHRETYGGTIPWVGSHALDLMLYFGEGDFQSVWAVQSRTDNHDHGDLEVAAQCQFLLTSGILAQASIDYLRPQAAPTHGDDRIRIAGTDGVLEVSGGKVILTDQQGQRELVIPPPERKIFSDFVQDIRGIRPALTNAEETFRLTRGCLLAQNSADQLS